ncbi:MAG: FAD-dependent oxidoreductase [Thermogutta sp.]
MSRAISAVAFTCAVLSMMLPRPGDRRSASAGERQPDAATAGDSPVYDVVIYGGTSAAVTAAVQTAKLGKSVVIVSPDKHLGGLSSGGLGFTDTGNKAVIGGLSREFYHRIWQHYQQPDAWRWQSREAFGNRGQGTPAVDGELRTMWAFEPHVAEQVFDAWLAEHAIPVWRNALLDREKGVRKSGRRIASITTLEGKTFRGRVFIDATYEGDLMAAAGVSYNVGREGRDVYGEEWAGVQTGVFHHGHYFKKPVDPYVVPGDPASGLLPRISPDPPGEKGQGDHRVQAYCFRMCLTKHPENRVPFAKPDGYDPSQYALLLRVFETGWRELFVKYDPIPNAKTDTNNHGPFSTDNIGYNYDYPEASYERRREIIAEHERYQKGLMYFMANDPRVPEDVRKAVGEWGLAKDEFADNGHWPHQLYIREARRMIGRFVMTEHELLRKRPTPESVGMGSYTIDSHNVQRYVTPEGFVQNEGDIGVRLQPYKIAYGSLTPKAEECENLLVPVCVSSSHVAYGSIRMEPVFMILGQSAATAAVMAVDGRISVQEVDYAALRGRLLADGQILEYPPVSPESQASATDR